MSIHTRHSLTGVISSRSSITGQVVTSSSLTGGMTVGTVFSDNTPPYDGEYEVTPSTENEVILKTSNKLMLADVQVKKIPYYDVTNSTGGSTVYIGSEV